MVGAGDHPPYNSAETTCQASMDIYIHSYLCLSLTPSPPSLPCKDGNLDVTGFNLTI